MLFNVTCITITPPQLPVLCSIRVAENFEDNQLTKKFPIFMKLNVHYHVPKSALSLDPILKQFSPSYPFMHSHLRSHFSNYSHIMYISPRQSLCTTFSDQNSECLNLYRPHPSYPPISDHPNTTGWRAYSSAELEFGSSICISGTHMGVWCEGTWYLIRFSTWKSTNLSTPTQLLPTSGGPC